VLTRLPRAILVLVSFLCQIQPSTRAEDEREHQYPAGCEPRT
jgi:hypothetical protein